MTALAKLPNPSQPDILNACKRCGRNDDFFTEPAKPPHYLAQRCRNCGLFARFISKIESVSPKPYKPVGEQVRADFNSPHDNSHKSCSERFEKIERELTILMRAVLSFGTLQGTGSPPTTDVDDALVDKLVRELAEGEAAR